ncbi:MULTISPECIES: relaxase/mobilization nuclease domain-containing protein [Vibrio]|nr:MULTISPECIES: DNA-primase RepB domain-containing protein [Vibrio]MCA2486032.1 relaxase/mobilization nuclease domain-containing protein [Vibrio alginolyticus]MDW2282335.1 DNA-primase RepB domain-containing protein [Vibrio sp. 1402]MDW2328454.1 DNA-primase RepB domain-containing protein [Vibrio sp. 1401]
MKAKVNRGNGFRGLANYILDSVKGAELLGGNMSGKNSRELAKEFAVCRKLRPNINRPAWHVSLALPAGENIDDSMWCNVAQRFLEEMGVDINMHQYFLGKHSDTNNEHIHIGLNRIGFNGELYHGRNDVMLAIQATHKLEKEFGLQLTPTFEERKQEKSLTSNEIQMAARTGEVPARAALQNILNEALTDKLDVFAFIERCEAAGATVIPNVASTGRLNGFAFEYQGIKFKGSDLGAKYTYKNLKEVVIYEQDRQSAELIAAAQTIKQRLNAVSERDAATEQQESRPDPAGNGKAEHATQSPDQRNEQSERLGEVDKIGTSEEQGRAIESNSEDAQCRNQAEEAEQQRSVANEVAMVDSGLADWGDADNHISDIVAPIVAVSNKCPSANTVRKQQLWQQQAEALQADKYRITLIGRQGQKPWVLGKQKDGTEKFYSVEEVKNNIPLLSKKNAEGRDIYITPITLDYHYIVVDDLTPETHKEMLANGYSPNLVQESSRDNYQAIFRVPKTTDEKDREIANKVVVGLNKRYGDENFTGVSHPFRMAGFSNKKPTRNNFFTRLISSSANACQRVITLLKQELDKVIKEREEAKQAYQNAKVQQPKQISLEEERLRKIASVDATTKTADAVFMRHWSKWHGLAKSKGWSIDYSRIDFAATIDMIKGGYNDEEILIAIVNSSPSVVDRKNDVQDYTRRTLEKAKIKLGDGDDGNNQLSL